MGVYTRIVRTGDLDSRVRIWEVEWKRKYLDKWSGYASADNLPDAEKRREICFANDGMYPVVFRTRNRFRRYKVVSDFSNGEQSYIVYVRLPLEKWIRCCSALDYESAVSMCSKMAVGNLPKVVSHTGPVKYLLRFAHAVESFWLCVRFPFLYPRNRFTGKHYSDYKLDTKISYLFNESHECTNPVDFHKGMSEDELRQMKNPEYRVTDSWKAVKCGFLKIYRFLLETVHSVPTYTELDAMDHGWRKAFGVSMCKEIKRALKKAGCLRKYRIMQIKEKWGELCWYDAGAPKEVFDIIRKYETVSYNTCIECGRPAKYRTTGWVEPYCEDCLPKSVIEQGNYRLKTEESGWIEIDRNYFHIADERLNNK